MKQMRLILSVILTVSFVFAMFSPASALQDDTECCKKNTIIPSETDYPEFRTYSLDGDYVFSNATFDENEITLVYFWVTTCGPSIDELYTLQQVYSTYSDRIKIISVLYDSSQTDAVELAKAILSSHNITLPTFRCSDSLRNAFPVISFFPVSFVVFQGGVFIQNIFGTNSLDAWNQLLNNIIEQYESSTVNGVCGADGDNLIWKYHAYSQELQISGTGEMKDYSEDAPAPWHNYKSLITSVKIDESVTGIGNEAFYECCAMQNITIPRSLKRIGAMAFYDCESVSYILIPENVETISEDAFNACNSLLCINVDLNNMWFSSYDGILFDKKRHTLVRCPLAKDSICIIPNGVEMIGRFAFLDCCLLSSIIIPESVTLIKEGAFGFCSFGTITLPSHLSIIEDYAFVDCQFSYIVIPESVSSIGYRAFYGSSLEKAIFMGAPTECFGDDVFDWCMPDFSIFYTYPYAIQWSPNGESEWNGYPICPIDVHSLDIDYVFNTGNVAAPSYSCVIPEGVAFSIPSPEIDGYQSDIAVVEGIMGDENILLTVTYTKINAPEYLVLFVDWDGTILKRETVIEGSAAVPPEDPSREGHTFTGWSGVYLSIYSDSVFIATYSINSYLVIFFDPITEQAISTQEIVFGQAAQAPYPPEHEGFVFIGWDSDFNCISCNTIVIAIYEQEQPTPYLKADVNCDGLINSADISIAAAFAMNAGSVKSQGIINGDMNGDGVLDVADLSALYSYIQG